MLKYALFFISSIITIFLVSFLNGNLKIEKLPLPALGKFFDPHKGVWANAKSAYDDISISEESLSAPSKIIYDERYVPHIFCKTVEDAMFLQGYVEASNRLFQMDFLARSVEGRLAEALGPKLVQTDIDRRRSGLHYGAQLTYKEWLKYPEKLKTLQRYVDGANAYISKLDPKDYPIEYKILGIKPDLWTLEKCTYVLKHMSNVLCGASNDLAHTNLRAKLGDELFSKLYEMSDPATTPVIPSEKKYELPTASNYAMADTTEEGAIPNIVFEKPVEGVGSNNWAVSPSKSSTGHAILCGDPHLALNLPSVWIEMQISTDSFNSYGVSIPGMAGIMIGFNEHMAWSETNVGIDVKDFYRIKWKDKTRKEYWLDSVWKPAQMDIKEIKVKGRPSVFDTMYITDLGIVNTISTDATQDLAMRWIATEPLSSPEFMTFIDLMQCKNVDQFNEKLSVFNSPAQNFISADIDGNISLRVNGKIPVRGLRDGLFIEDGTKSSNLWSSYIPFSELPHLKNPLQGYLTSSNQKSTDASYPYYYSLPSADHFRNRVINEILAQPKSFSVKDMRTMQGNTISAKARAMVPLITSNLIPENAKLSEVFKDWDFRYDKGELAPAVFDEYFSKLSEEVYDEVFKLKDSFDIRLPMSYVLINLVANEPNSSIFDLKSTPSIVESAKDIINRVATAYLNDKESSLAKNEVWPKRKKLDIPHILRLPALSVNDLEVDGSGDAINAVGNVAPSWRMVVHLNKNNIEAWGVYPGGQSGDPASKYYKNFIDKWVRREHYKLYFAKTAEDFTNNKVQAITFSKA